MPHYPVPFTFGNYDLLEALPTGGSGAVYKAHHRERGDMVAIKFFDHDPKREPTRYSYFVNEQSLLRAITTHRQHPYIIKHVSHNFTKEPFYIVTRYIEEAHSLTTMVNKSCEPGFVLRVVEQLSTALDYIHYAHPNYSPIVHRDVNPNNILIDNNGNAVLIDFGSALHAQFALKEEKGLGTVAYMPPEQYEGGEVPATDQFALAAVTLRMLTGKDFLPSNTQAARNKLKQLNDRENGKNEVRKMLGHKYTHTAAVISIAMSYNPDSRYASCETFAYYLRNALQADACELTPTYLKTRTRGEWGWLGWIIMVAIITGALIMLVLGIIGG